MSRRTVELNGLRVYEGVQTIGSDLGFNLADPTAALALASACDCLVYAPELAVVADSSPLVLPRYADTAVNENCIFLGIE